MDRAEGVADVLETVIAESTRPLVLECGLGVPHRAAKASFTCRLLHLFEVLLRLIQSTLQALRFFLFLRLHLVVFHAIAIAVRFNKVDRVLQYRCDS